MALGPGSSPPFVLDQHIFEFVNPTAEELAGGATIENRTTTYTIPANRYGIMHVPVFSKSANGDIREVISPADATRLRTTDQRFHGALLIPPGSDVALLRESWTNESEREYSLALFVDLFHTTPFTMVSRKAFFSTTASRSIYSIYSMAMTLHDLSGLKR